MILIAVFEHQLSSPSTVCIYYINLKSVAATEIANIKDLYLLHQPIFNIFVILNLEIIILLSTIELLTCYYK